jgi:hypothetical protein
LADLVYASSTQHISWPLVSYCDKIWGQMFGTNGPLIFYSVTSEHNYKILPFTQQLSDYLRDILATTHLDALLSGQDMYCLLLPSSEDGNLPLYANIGHEFGHAVFHHKSRAIAAVLQTECAGAFNALYDELRTLDLIQAERRFRRLVRVIVNMATELFCDLVGARLMGPAFFLSLYELSWGQDKDVHSVVLSPDDRRITAYPSFNFRLYCIRSAADIEEFCRSAKQDFGELPEDLRGLATSLDTIPSQHSSDRMQVWPSSDPDSQALEQALSARHAQVESSLERFVQECQVMISGWYSLPSPAVRTRDVGQLVLRLTAYILPNIVPDGSLLGTPATFTAIITASALVRLRLLARANADGQEAFYEELGIIERLTAKALEVSFIQAEYNAALPSL